MHHGGKPLALGVPGELLVFLGRTGSDMERLGCPARAARGASELPPTSVAATWIVAIWIEALLTGRTEPPPWPPPTAHASSRVCGVPGEPLGLLQHRAQIRSASLSATLPLSCRRESLAETDICANRQKNMEPECTCLRHMAPIATRCSCAEFAAGIVVQEKSPEEGVL
jgi:hypothetical protein